MSVADRNTECKPEAPKTAEEARRQIDSLAADLRRCVDDAARRGDSFDAVERKVYESVLALGRQAMNLLLLQQGDGDLGPEVDTAEGRTLRRSEEKRSTPIRSIFGEHEFEQFIYSPGPKRAVELRPVSAHLSLPARKWSYLLQEFSQMLAVDTAYEQAMETLKAFFGGSFSVATTEKINGDMGREAGPYLNAISPPDPASEAKLLVASADCKGVPLVKQDAAKVAAFETAKKAPGNRRMATVASVYTVEPHVRTPEKITAALFRDQPAKTKKSKRRPMPQNKITTAHMPELADAGTEDELAISGIHVEVAWIATMVAARRRAGQTLIVLMDGQPSLWDAMRLHFSFRARTVKVLDPAQTLLFNPASLSSEETPALSVARLNKATLATGGLVVFTGF